jgi:hypothetical protein
VKIKAGVSRNDDLGWIQIGGFNHIVPLSPSPCEVSIQELISLMLNHSLTIFLGVLVDQSLFAPSANSSTSLERGMYVCNPTRSNAFFYEHTGRKIITLAYVSPPDDCTNAALGSLEG